jgi:hypothetical protein
MNVPPEVGVAALDHHGCGLQVMFTWLGDRYGHSILGARGAEATPLLEANSATSRYGFPAAPPLSEAVKHQTDESRPSLLLTGSGDRNYWSATVTTITDVHFAMATFDFACRQGRHSAPPVVAYRIAHGVKAEVRAAKRDVLLRTADGREFRLWAAAIPTSLATENVATCRVLLTRQGIVIEPLGSPHVTTGTTVPWRYEISAVRQR